MSDNIYHYFIFFTWFHATNKLCLPLCEKNRPCLIHKCLKNFDLYHKEPFKTIMGLDTDLVFGFEDLLIEQILDILEFKSKLCLWSTSFCWRWSKVSMEDNLVHKYLSIVLIGLVVFYIQYAIIISVFVSNYTLPSPKLFWHCNTYIVSTIGR